MTIERLEELKEWFHDVAGRLVSSFHAENCYRIDELIGAEIERQSKVSPTTKLLDGAKRYVLTNMVWFGDTTFTDPKLTDIGELIVNLIDDEIDRQKALKESTKFDEAFETAILKKQIPKKPMSAEDNSWGIKTEGNVCPECNNFLPHYEFASRSRKLTYCDICGQAIDWSEE